MKQSQLTQTAQAHKLQDHERQRCEVWTRVMGYYRPVSQFNLGKKSEHKERLHFKESCQEQRKAG